MLAAAFLTIAAAGHARQPAPAGQIPLTRNEIAHLLATLTSPARDARHRLDPHRFRRHHPKQTFSPHCRARIEGGADLADGVDLITE